MPFPTDEQALIRRLAACYNIHTREQAQEMLGDRFGHPEWVRVFDEALTAMEPWEYATDDAPNIHHPEWDHLRSEPWDKNFKIARINAGLNPDGSSISPWPN